MHGSMLLVEIGGIILGLGLLGALSNRFGISPIPLYLVAGLIFGHGGLLPLATSEEFIATGAEIGVILLLFTLGLEYTATELVTTLRTSALGGVIDLVLNAAPGVILALVMGWGPVAALALGGVTYVTSSGVAAKVLTDLDWLGNRETPVVLSLLVMEDLAMALYLPILTAVLAGVGFIGGSVTLAIAVATVSVVLFIALRYGRLVEKFIDSSSQEVLLLKVFGLTLLVAGIAQALQVSAAVGAFLVGIALSGPLAHTARELLTPLRDLFAAVFFVFFGLHTDPADLPPVLVPAVLLVIAGIVTKFVTGWLAAHRAGIGRLGRARAGALMLPRGEFNIVIAGLAVAAGAHASIGPLAACYVLLLAVVSPLLARAVEPLLRHVGTIAERRRSGRLRTPAPRLSSPSPPEPELAAPTHHTGGQLPSSGQRNRGGTDPH